MLKSKWLKDGYVVIEGSQVKAGNAAIERVWAFEDGGLLSRSIYDKKNQIEWLSPAGRKPMFQFPWLSSAAKVTDARVNAYEDDDHGISKPYLRADVDMNLDHGDGGLVVRLTIKIYPGASFIRHEFTVRSGYRASVREIEAAPSFIAWIQPDRKPNEDAAGDELQLDDNNQDRGRAGGDYCDLLPLQHLHCRWETVSFRDQTDTHNNLISKDNGLMYVNEQLGLRGNLLRLQSTLHDGGLLMMKEGPTPLGDLQPACMDFYFHGKSLSVQGSGITQEDVASGEPVTSYGTMVGVYDGNGYNSLRLLNDYHRNLRQYRPERDSFLMSNTWGDRSKDSALHEGFLLKELQAASNLGLTMMQIDDGWQKGITCNSVNAVSGGGLWSDYYSGDGEFWQVHPERFPNGLSPIVAAADERGVKLGLWFSPDSSDHYVNWEKDVATLLQLHDKYGIAAFKLDGIDIRSKLGETRLLNMMRQVVKATGGEVVLNIDATAQQRLGYFGQTHYGTIFLENRYTDWGNYYPHWTLRNLWLLMPYISADRLQMEYLNVSRNRDKYMEDPLAPYHSGQAYAFMVAAFTNALAWMETSGLDALQSASLAKVIEAVKPHHPAILGGHVLPLGEEPSGTSWTGLQSITDPYSGYLLIIREKHQASQDAMELWGVERSATLSLKEIIRMEEKDVVMANQSEEIVQVQADASGKYPFVLSAPFSFVLYRYQLTE
ncbi:alpha-galactosidase [Paenibacillus sp. GCM10023248]|uniref:alpha-galactosidase n=1 Tax=unclassified Paenibacillus TaxID=185978 RepID=UPI002379BBEC|nr:alpha-galactosidase [Paenibacillus sp. MAHUQ-63]MDD9269481.1 alpha-galactosidase [Paenibacillus sp. MAHUQ-63]